MSMNFSALARAGSLGLLMVGVASSQVKPASARTSLYFPQIVDGGSSTEQWQTTFTFGNPNSDAVAVTLRIYRSDGTPWPLDLGAGSASEHSMMLPAAGVRTMRSRVASPVIGTGWAFAAASLPIQATASYRQFLNRVPRVEVTAEPTIRTFAYTSFASPLLGVAIANPDSGRSIPLWLTVRDAGGTRVGEEIVWLSPQQHRAFNLREKFPALASGFIGSLLIETLPPNRFIAWTLNGDGTLVWALPPGAYAWPAAEWDVVWEVFLKVWNAAQNLSREIPEIGSFGTPAPELSILAEFRGERLNAFGGAPGVIVTRGLAQLISDSPSELAWLVAHELGHVYQRRTGRLLFDATNREFDADVWGLILALTAGYDPYGAAGALAKMAMVTGSAGLARQFEDDQAADAHKSFNTRLELLFDTLVVACREVPDTCAAVREFMHPDFPVTAPLRIGEAASTDAGRRKWRTR